MKKRSGDTLNATSCRPSSPSDQVVFPGASQDLSSQYWSSTSDVNTTFRAWYVLFGEGATSTDFKASRTYALRFVRGGQAADAFDLFPPPIPPPLLQGAGSRKAHGGAGTFDLPLAP